MTARPYHPPGHGLRLDPESARFYGRRGGTVRAAQCAVHVSGETLTLQQIADRLGTTREAARKRIARLRRACKPITWENLK